MLSIGPTVRVFVAVAPFNMHRSFDGLAGEVRRLSLNPLDGHLYVFLNTRRTLMKALFFDRSGYCIFSKRLAQGSFQLPTVAAGVSRVEVDGAVLAMMLEGIDLRAPRRLRYERKPTSK
jgi:transposase